MLNKTKVIISIVISMIVFALEIYCLIKNIDYLVKGGENNKYRYYTNIANLVVGFICLANAIVLLIGLSKNNGYYPISLSIIKFIGISMITLTFFMVLCFIPVYGFKRTYGNDKLITHLIVPVLVVTSYLFFEDKKLFKWKWSLLAIAPLIIYCVVYIINVICLHTWPDLYRVNKKGIWFVFVLIAVVSNFAVSQGLFFLKKFIDRVLN